MGYSCASYVRPSISHRVSSSSVLWERRDECPGAVPVLVCHDEIVIECDAEQAVDVKAWLERVMIEGMNAVLNGTEEVRVPVEVELRIDDAWGES